MRTFCEVAPCVFSTRLYSSTECREIVDQARQQRAWQPAAISADAGDTERCYVDKESRFASILSVCGSERLYSAFERRAAATIVRWVIRQWRTDVRIVSDTQLVRYRVGGHFQIHTDAGETGATAARHFTIVCYLNDDFLGGRTWFPSLGFKAKPSPGTAIVFPSRFAHCGEVIEQGEKFVFVTWLIGTRPVQWIR